MESKECPHCGLTNPASAERCDCGYDFESKMMKPSYAADAPKPAVQSRPEPREPAGAGAGKPRHHAPFMDIVWQKAAVLAGFYWLLRWLAPSILPESMGKLKFQETMFVCIILGFIWGGISYLLRRPAPGERAAIIADKTAVNRKAQIDHFARKYRDAPDGSIPDLKNTFRKRYRIMAIAGGVTLGAGLLLFGISTNSSQFPFFAFLLVMMGTISATLGLVLPRVNSHFPNKDELTAAIKESKQISPKKGPPSTNADR